MADERFVVPDISLEEGKEFITLILSIDNDFQIDALHQFLSSLSNSQRNLFLSTLINSGERLPDDPEYLDQDEVLEVFNQIIAEQLKRTTRIPLWIPQVFRAFAGRVNAIVTLKQITDQGFPKQKTAQDSLSTVRVELAKKGYEIEHVPAYRIRRRRE